MARRRSLITNFVASAGPVSCAVDTVLGVESPASAVSPKNVLATREQGGCADRGLDAEAGAYGGALAAALGGPSGVPSDAAPGAALAALQRRQADAEKQAAARLRDSMHDLNAPAGSRRLFVLMLCGCRARTAVFWCVLSQSLLSGSFAFSPLCDTVGISAYLRPPHCEFNGILPDRPCACHLPMPQLPWQSLSLGMSTERSVLRF